MIREKRKAKLIRKKKAKPQKTAVLFIQEILLELN